MDEVFRQRHAAPDARSTRLHGQEIGQQVVFARNVAADARIGPVRSVDAGEPLMVRTAAERNTRAVERLQPRLRVRANVGRALRGELGRS